MGEAVSANQLVDKLVEWDKLIKDGKKEMDAIKAKLQQIALGDIQNKKVKQTELWGSNNSKVVVTVTDTVELVSYTFLKRILGDIVKDFVKTEDKYKMTEPFKRIMAAAFNGEYVEESVSDIVNGMDIEDIEKKALKRKLRNNFKKNVEYLKTIAKMDDQTAEHYAYFIQEASAYQQIAKLLEAAGHKKGTEEFKQAFEALKDSVIVDESLKIGLEYEAEEKQDNGADPA